MMEAVLILMYVYAFVVGCCMASFINVVIYRVPLGISVAKGRSFCPSCQHQLHALDLIPILSYICLGGKCRYCHEHIGMRDTLLELLGGLLGMLCFYRYGFSMMTVIAFAFAMMLQAIAFIDLDTMEIPNGLVVGCFIIGFISIPFLHIDMISRIIGIFIVSVPLIVLNMVIPDAFGGGDIKLLAACGFFMGWVNVLIGMFIAVLLAGGYAIYLMLSHKIDKGGHIAFGPYLCIGMFISLLYGSQLLSSYLSLFGL